ncbi:MAG: hypothetical protein A2X94_03530 [Bdellovibrionales bacterium GWB1_55_8]|nr:MAG: hypothetical protein A2X94_03530 [Bdellovibrionales bacterium GWB1_55_8]
MRTRVLVMVSFMAMLISVQGHAFGKRKPSFEKPEQFSNFASMNITGERVLAEIEARRWQGERQKLEIRVFGSHMELDSQAQTSRTPLLLKEEARASDGSFEVLVGSNSEEKIGLALSDRFEFLVFSWNPATPDRLLIKAYVDGSSSPVEIRYEAQPEESRVLLCKSPGDDIPELYWARVPLKHKALARYYTLSGSGTFQYLDQCWTREGDMLAMYQYPSCALVLSEARLLVDLRREIGIYYYYPASTEPALDRSSLICIER